MEEIQKEEINMNRKKFWAGGLAVLLAAVTLVAPVCAAASPPGRAAESGTENPLDFSVPNSISSELSSGELLSRLLASLGTGESASAAETEYLDRYCKEALYYSAYLPGDLVTVSVSDGGEELLVEAQSYDMQGRNGKTVRWIPISALYNGEEKPLQEGKTSFQREDQNYRVTVSYRGEAELPSETANLILNYAYSDLEQARVISAERESYGERHRLWEENRAAWETYEEELAVYEKSKASYPTKLFLWESNQAAWAKYDTDNAAYLENKGAWEAYNRAWNTYFDSAEYQDYLRKDEEYRAIIEEQNKARVAMVAMESIYRKPVGMSDLYTALQNAELVKMFEKYQDVLSAKAGVSKKDIQEMRASSDRLNELLGLYAEARKVSEGAAFACYKENYREISQLFNTLYDKMRAILTGTVFNFMCVYMNQEYGHIPMPDTEFAHMGEYKAKRIKIILCHIYLVSRCLDDTRSPDTQWQFYKNDGDPRPYNYGELLDQRVIVSDTNASDPSALAWRELPAEIPVAPTAPTPPSVKLAEPLPPSPKWEKPEEPTPPDEPDPMWEEPSWPGGDELLERVKALSEQSIEGREEVTEAKTITLSVTSVAATANNLPVVYRRGADGGWEVTDLDPYDLPATLESYQTNTHIYTFSCWSASPDEALPVGDSKHIYPYYTKTEREYRVIFSVAGVEHERIFKWEDEVGFDGSTEKASEHPEQYSYTFSHWSPPLETVPRDGLRHEAVYTRTPRSYEVRFELGDRVISKQVAYGSVPTPPTAPAKYTSGNRIYEFAAWEPRITAVQGNVTYRAAYTSRPLTEQSGDGEPLITDSEETLSYSVTVRGDWVSIGELVACAKEEGKTVDVIFSDVGATVSFDRNAMAWLNPSKGVCLSLRRTESGGVTSLAFRVTNSNGAVLTGEGGIRLLFTLPSKADGKLTVTAHYTGGLWKNVTCRVTDRAVEFLAETDATYRIERTYQLTIGAVENGALRWGELQLRVGEKISVQAFPRKEYRIGAIILKNIATGETVTVDSLDALVMPAYDAELLVEFVPILYTVRFEYYGGFAEATYKRGEMPQIPLIENTYEENGYFYTFSGWSSPVTTVTGDTVYTATYHGEPIETRVEDDKGNVGRGFFLRIVLPALLILLGIAAVITVPLVIRGKKKKKKRQAEALAAEDEEESHGPSI